MNVHEAHDIPWIVGCWQERHAPKVGKLNVSAYLPDNGELVDVDETGDLLGVNGDRDNCEED